MHLCVQTTRYHAGVYIYNCTLTNWHDQLTSAVILGDCITLPRTRSSLSSLKHPRCLYFLDSDRSRWNAPTSSCKYDWRVVVYGEKKHRNHDAARKQCVEFASDIRIIPIVLLHNSRPTDAQTFSRWSCRTPYWYTVLKKLLTMRLQRSKCNVMVNPYWKARRSRYCII